MADYVKVDQVHPDGSIEQFIAENQLRGMLCKDKPMFEDGAKVTILYHKNCMDGFVSAYLTEHLLRRALNAQDVLFMAMQYNDMLPDVDADNFVFMVDFCMDPKTLSLLASKCRGLTVIDHHYTQLSKVVPAVWDGSYNVIFADENVNNMAATGIMLKLAKFVAGHNDTNKFLDEDLEAMAQVVNNYDIWAHDGKLDSHENRMKNFFSKFIQPIYFREREYLDIDPLVYQPNVTLLVKHMLDNWKDASGVMDGQVWNTALYKGEAAQGIIHTKELTVLPHPRRYFFTITPLGDHLDTIQAQWPELMTDSIKIDFHTKKTPSELVAHLSAPEILGNYALLLVKMKEHDETNPDAVWTIRWRGPKKSPITAAIVAEHFGGGGHVGASGLRTELTDDDFIKEVYMFVGRQLGMPV